MTTNKQVQFLDLGLIDYQKAWDYQEQRFAEIVAMKIENRNAHENARVATPNYVLFCEHPHVYTLGKSGKPENLLIDAQQLAQKNATYHRINRGGDITYHGPGQLVCYPILDLDHFFTDIHRYMRTLEEAVILTLAHYNIEAGRIDGLTGVWLGGETQQNPRKICAMGVKASRWVTMHGLALNVNTDLSYFEHIVPCGIDDKAVTSMQIETGKALEMNEVTAVLKKNLIALFGMKPIVVRHLV